MEQPKTLEQAVTSELEKQDIFPVIEITGHLAYVKDWTEEDVKRETSKALQTLRTAGAYERSTGIGRGVSEYLKRKNNSLGGKKV